MHEEERIALEPCGCHVDKPTGLITLFCRKHNPEPTQCTIPSCTCGDPSHGEEINHDASHLRD